MAIFDCALVRLLPAVPKPVVQRLSERYIAGETLEDARGKRLSGAIEAIVEGLSARRRFARLVR